MVDVERLKGLSKAAMDTYKRQSSECKKRMEANNEK